MRIVLKFGGTSLKNPEQVRRAARRAIALKNAGWEVVCVVSARGHTTDHILAEAAAITADADLRELDALLSAGEQLSAATMALTIQTLGCRAISLTGWQAGIRTDSSFGNAQIGEIQPERIQKELKKGTIVVAAGFQGISPDGDITTLGRGGSDTTAVALAARLKAEKCLIFTDVDGVYDRDPRIFPDAVRFDRIDYDHMLTLARSGAQVLHPRCVEIGKAYHVPIQVLSSFREGEGTLVTDI